MDLLPPEMQPWPFLSHHLNLKMSRTLALELFPFSLELPAAWGYCMQTAPGHGLCPDGRSDKMPQH